MPTPWSQIKVLTMKTYPCYLKHHIPSKLKKNWRPGLSIVELVITIVIGSIIMAAVIGLFSVFINTFEEDTELSTARQRGQMVFAILTGPVLSTSLGIPNTSADIQTCFAENATLSTWSAPIKITGDNTLELIYAIPTGIGITQETEFRSTDGPFTIDLTESSSFFVNIADKNKTDAWVTFPSAGTAFLATNIFGSTITIEPTATGLITFFDEVHCVRALKASVASGRFEAQDLTRGELLGSVDGISDLHFEYDTDNRVLTAYVLARSSTRKEDQITPATLDEWPGGAISAEDRHYRLSVFRTSWRIRN